MTKLKTAVAGAVLVAGVGTPLLMQHQALKETRSEIQVLQEQTRELDQLRAQNERLAQSQIPPNELERFRAERAELQGLRAQVADLLRDRQALASGGAPPLVQHTSAVVWQAPFIRAEDLVDAGMATPEATIETMFWAGLHDESDRAYEIMDLDRWRSQMFDYLHQVHPDAAPASPEEVDSPIHTFMPADYRKEFVGFQLMSQRFHTPDHVELEVGASLASGQIDTLRLILRQTGEAWKLDLIASAALSYPKQASLDGQ